jgi:hypothetical protein
VEILEKERSMKRPILAVLLATLLLVVPYVWAQDKEKSTDSAKPSATEKAITPLRVQVVFTEFDGDKKIGSLPYTFLVNADDRGSQAAVRMTFHVPVAVSSDAGAKHVGQYPLTTNLDGRAEKTDDGRFLLRLSLEKSSIYLAGANQKPASLGGSEVSANDPVQQEFRTQVNLLVRDGQTIQSTVATDPVSGHVLKIDVTVNVIK